MNPAFYVLPLTRAILTRVTVQLLCLLETTVLRPCDGFLQQKSLMTFFYCPIVWIDFRISLSINNSVDIIHSLVIFAGRVWLSVGIDIATEKLLQRFDDLC